MESSLLTQTKRYSLVAFFLLAFLISWSVWIPAALASQGIIPSFSLSPALTRLLGVFGPSLAGITMTDITHGSHGLRKLFKRLFLWRVGIQWYLFALFWPAILLLVVTALSMLFDSPAPDFGNPPLLHYYPLPAEALSAGFLPLLPFVFLQQFLISSPMGEELGWRGYALPQLQAKQSALQASIILGVMWGLWHLPLFWTKHDPLAEVNFGWYMIDIVLSAVLFTWVYNNTKGSLLIALLFHTSIAVTGLFLSSVTNPLLLLILKAAFVVGVVVMAGSTRLSREPFQKPS